MKIIRADGSVDEFRPEKLEKSLKRAGASGRMAEEVARKVEQGMKGDETTRDIYKKAFALLKEQHAPVAARYTLKEAIMSLGPSGYPFEQLLGRVYKKEGYEVSYPEVTRGRCVNHEVDVVAEKRGEKLAIEAKFHNQPGFKVDVKTALYVKARYDDISAVKTNKFTAGSIVTNTKFTVDAIRYSQCVGLNLLGWGYPKNKGLELILEESKVLPITMMMTFSKKDKEIMLRNEIVACGDIAADPGRLERLGISRGKINKCLMEMEGVIKLG